MGFQPIPESVALNGVMTSMRSISVVAELVYFIHVRCTCTTSQFVILFENSEKIRQHICVLMTCAQCHVHTKNYIIVHTTRAVIMSKAAIKLLQQIYAA